ARRVDDGAAALLGGEVRGGPAGDLEFGVAGRVTALHAVAVLEPHDPVGVDEDGAERLVAVVERLTGELDAAAQVHEVVRGGWRHGSHAAILARSGPDREEDR